VSPHLGVMLTMPRSSSIDNGYYSPISNLCLPTQTGYRFAGIFIWAVPLVFDLLLVVLTTIRAYWSAILRRTESGSSLVR
jgi:hypothetical protein